MRAPDFWDDQSQAQSVSTKYSRIRSRLEDYNRLAAQVGRSGSTARDGRGGSTDGEEMPAELIDEVERLVDRYRPR